MPRPDKRSQKLGPWSGGLNDILEPSAIGDDELADIINFEQEQDGSLVNRPAIVADAALPVVGADHTLLGPDFYITSTATYAVFTVGATTRIYDIVLKTWTQIATFKASGWVQYDNKIVLICETQAGGYWEAGVFTATATMPLGSDIVFFKERLWAFGIKGTSSATTVWFSNLTAAGPPATTIWTWSVLDFFTVSMGDGQWITGMITTTNDLIIFRNASTWKFSYSTSPLTGGNLQILSTEVGADNKWSFGRYENYFIVLNNGTLYELINQYYYPLNDRKVSFQRSAALGSRSIETCLSIFEDRAIVWYYGATYCFNVRLRGWAKWSSPTTYAARFLQIPQSSLVQGAPACIAVTGGTVADMKVVYRIAEGTIDTAGEEIACMIRTKAYDFGSTALKRLFHYDAEVRTARGLHSIAVPIALPRVSEATWNAMSAGPIWPTTHPDGGNYMQLQTWNSPLDPTSETKFDETVSFPSTVPLLLLINLLRAGFFRRIYFEFYLSCDGTASTSPARLFSARAYIGEKAFAAQKVS